MAGLPGSIPGLVPAGEDETQRRLADLERRMNEMGPSVAKSFGPMLATVVAAGQAGVWGTNFGVSVTQVAVAVTSITTPAGFTTAAVFANAHVSAINNVGPQAYLYVGARIAGVLPTMLAPALVPAGFDGDAHGSHSRIVTGLTTGATIDLAAVVSTTGGSTWTAVAGNRASIDAIAIFYR